MNELEQIRDALIGIRAQVAAALAAVERVIQAVNAEEEEPEVEGPPRTFGSSR
jgi:hypothetical protein